MSAPSTPATAATGTRAAGTASGSRDDFRDGKPHAVHAFGTKLVVLAGADGKLNVLDGYCRHMGGDLTQGTVKGDKIACPFHDWRWGGDGRAWASPTRSGSRCGPAPARGPRSRSNGMLFVWNDPEGNPPHPEVELPAHRRRRLGRVDRLDLDDAAIEGSNCREIIDNVVGHGALLLRPLRLPDVLQERLRGPRRHPVHGVARPPRHRQGQPVRRRGQPAEVRGVLLRAVVHDQLALERLQGHRRSSRS